jgi:hypothetical protein
MDIARAQTTDTVLMIRPVGFRSNPQTAATNAFQIEPGVVDPAVAQQAAATQFQGLVDVLRGAGVNVIVETDTPESLTPDAIFPNNWLSTHASGVAVVYPMMAENRRLERRLDVVERLSSEHGFHLREVIDLSHWEREGRFLEGTGSVVLDRVNRIGYACLSPRTHLEVLSEFGQRLGYELVAFEACDADGIPIYHTNVMMSVGEGFAVLCDAAIGTEAQRRAILRRLERTGHEIVTLSHRQMADFAGNVLELRATDGSPVLAMSARAERALEPGQQERLRHHARIVSAAIDDIEKNAGGSVRCMLAEIHLPRRTEAA